MKGQAITKQEIRRIYALGAGAGLVESGNPDDLLHVAVRAVTGKENVSALTHEEYLEMQHHLIEKMQYKNREKPLEQRKPTQARSARHEERPGGVTAEQQKKVWYLMYQLRDRDGSAYSRATLGERLCGIIRKQMHRDCTPEEPFRFLTLADGWRLIEALKGMVENTKPRDGARHAK
jgi:hypothetical protein